MSDETNVHFHKLGESCADCDERRRTVKATPVEISATFDGYETHLTVPLWMFHSFSKMAREFAAQTPSVTYEIKGLPLRVRPDADA